jgi:CRP-like cAMP-binding protein
MNLNTSQIGLILDLCENERGFTPGAISRNSNPIPEIRARPSIRTNEPASVRNLLTHKQQEQVLNNAAAFAYRRGGITLFSEGENAGYLYFVDEGIIRVSRCAENGRRQILALRTSGDLLGRPENGRYVNSAETVGPARVYRVAWQRMHEMIRVDPQLHLHLLMKEADDFRRAERRIMILGQQNTCQRLVSFILDLLFLPEFFDEKRSLVKLPVNRFDLADYLGIVRKSCERALARLESEGLIRRVTSRTIEILNKDGLRLLQREQRGHH